MPPINLDDIVQYRPSADKPHLKPVQAGEFHPYIFSEASSDRITPNPLFPPNPDLQGQCDNGTWWRLFDDSKPFDAPCWFPLYRWFFWTKYSTN